MIPGKFCIPRMATDPTLKGLKQVGKTRFDGTRVERRYRCQDCGAICVMRGDTARAPGSPPFVDEWSQSN